jgi:hypothetical protein
MPQKQRIELPDAHPPSECPRQSYDTLDQTHPPGKRGLERLSFGVILGLLPILGEG